MLSIRNWEKWQGRGVADVRRKREQRGTTSERPYAMGYVFVASSLDAEHFGTFAELVGGAVAESYLIRVLQYVALHAALAGEVRVRRERFGPIVLSRAWDIVSIEAGAAVYDALVASRIAEPLGGDGTDARPGQPGAGPRPEAPDGRSDGSMSDVPDESEAAVQDASGTPVQDMSGTGVRDQRPGRVQASRARGPHLATPHHATPPHAAPRVSAPPDAAPPAAARERGGAPAAPGEGATTDDEPPGEHGPPLVPDDLGVFEMLWRTREKLLRADAEEADRLRGTLVAKRPDNDAIRRFIERLTPSRVDDVTKVRRAFRMAANARGGGPAR